MTDIETLSAEAKTIAQEQSKPGVFSFVDRILDRNYPTEEVEVYLDEASGYIIQKLQQQLSAATGDQYDIVEKQLEFQREKAAQSRYVVHVQGISVEEYDKVVDAARAEFPVEYRESRNPLTLEAERFVVENEDRDQFFRIQLWSKFIQKIVAPNGDEDTNVTPATVAVMMNALPIAAIGRVQIGIEKLRMTTDWMDQVQGADFLAKS